MELYSNNDYRNYLLHHGRKGQEWGVKHGPPYPLNKEGNAAFNRDIGKRVKAGSRYLVGSYDSDWQEVEVYEDDDTWEDVYAPTAELIKNAEERGESLYRGTSENLDDEVSKCNPDFGERGTTNNCTKCSATLELRKRGYDVQAGRSREGVQPGCMSYWFDGVESETFDLAHTNLQDIDSFAQRGARGSIVGMYGQTSGHCLYWESNGNYSFNFYDGQNGKSMKDVTFADMFVEYGFNADYPVFMDRLDQATPNWDHMAEDSVIRTRDTLRQKLKSKSTGSTRGGWY